MKYFTKTESASARKGKMEPENCEVVAMPRLASSGALETCEKRSDLRVLLASFAKLPFRVTSILVVLRALHPDFSAELGFDEWVEIAIHDFLDATGFLTGAEV